METPTSRDETVIRDIDAATTEWDSVVESWHVEDHRMAMEAVEWYEAWMTREQNG